MAVPFQVQIGRVSRFLSKWASTKGSSPVLVIGSEITPVLPLWSGVENRFLDSWNRFAAAFSRAAVANQNSAVRVINPAGSNVIAVFEKLRFSNIQGANSAAVQDVPTLSLQRPGAGVLGTPFAAPPTIDARVIVNSTLSWSSANNIGASGIILEQSHVNTTNEQVDLITFEDQELTLLPGDSWTVLTTAPASGVLLTMSAVWRERGLEESERQ